MAKSSSSSSKRQKLDPLSKCGIHFSDDYEDDGIELEDEETEQDDYSYRVLSPNEIVDHMNECIREVNTVLQLPATTVRILLNHFRWDKDKLLEAYYESDQEQLFKEARIINPNHDNSTVTASDGIAEECEICCASKPIDMMNEMQCGHRFCTECWNTYLTTKISDEGMGQTIACAAHDCPILVDDASVMKLLTDEKVKLRYQHLITNSFVQCHKRMKWCPAAGCSNAIRVQYSDCKPVHCTCGFEFCFQCGNLWHDPVKCSWLKKWLKNVDDDVQSSKWISANTKECPKCSASIQKNGGCNHMICKNQNCNAQFCWVCLRLWEAHGRQGGYNCNRYEDSGDKLEKSKRYFFYCNRYMNHMQSLKFENQLYESMKAKMEEMQQHGMRWIDVQFLNKSVDILCKCRQTLAYTYAFAFYLDKTNQSLIFESNQLDLESATEELSEYLERKVSAESVSDIKQKVQDKYGYCETRRKILLQHVHEGYEKDWWKFNDGN